MSTTAWHPYARDQEFGVRLASDEAQVDRFLAELGERNGPLLGGPVTTATALEAAVEIGQISEEGGLSPG